MDVRNVLPQTLVLFFGRGQLHSVVCRGIALVAEDEDPAWLVFAGKAGLSLQLIFGIYAIGSAGHVQLETW